MIKLFKNIDDKLLNLGFKKIKENEYGVRYERRNEKYTHVVTILRKASDKHMLQSYDKDLFDAQYIGNTAVGLTSWNKIISDKNEENGLYSKWLAFFG